MDIDTNPANYEPNSINDNWPRETPPAAKRGGFESSPSASTAKNPPAQPFVRRILRPAASVLAEPDAD